MAKEVVLTSGVKVRLVSVPSMLVLALTRQIKEPTVPMWHNDQKDRDEPNPLDPAYVQAVNDYKTEIGQKTTQAYLANGVKVLELPDDKYPEDSDEWVEGLEFVGIEVPKTGLGRRVAWLQYHVLGDMDLTDILSGIAIAGGVVTEEQVQAAAETFQHQTSGEADTTVQDTTVVRLGDKTGDTTRLSE